MIQNIKSLFHNGMTMTLCNGFVAQLLFSCNNYINTVSKSRLLFLALILFSYILSYGVQAIDDYKLTNIGAIIDVTSRIGKEENTAMEVAVQNFNNKSNNHKLSLYIQNPGKDPLLAAASGL